MCVYSARVCTAGGGHNIDHDDGSEYYLSDSNVVAYAQACKGNYGAHRRCERNLVLLPGVSMYKPAAGAHPGATCASESDNGRSSTYADKSFKGQFSMFKFCIVLLKLAPSHILRTTFPRFQQTRFQ